MPDGSEVVASFDLGISHYDVEDYGVDDFVVEKMKRYVELQAYFAGKEITARLQGEGLEFTARRFWRELVNMEDIDCFPVAVDLNAYFEIPPENRALFKTLAEYGWLEDKFSATLEVGELKLTAYSIRYD